MFPVIATFKDANGNILDMTNIAVFPKSFNTIIRSLSNTIQIVKGDDNMIAGVSNGRFAYITHEDFSKLNITADTKEQTFIMRVVSEKENNDDYIKTIAGRR